MRINIYIKKYILLPWESTTFFKSWVKKQLAYPELCAAVWSAKHRCWICAISTTKEAQNIKELYNEVYINCLHSTSPPQCLNYWGLLQHLGVVIYTGLQSSHINHCSVLPEDWKSYLLDLLLTSLRDLYWVADSSLLTARTFPPSFYHRHWCRPACRCCAELTQWQTALPVNY